MTYESVAHPVMEISDYLLTRDVSNNKQQTWTALPPHSKGRHPPQIPPLAPSAASLLVL